MEKQKKTKKEVLQDDTLQKDLKKTKKVRPDLTSQKDLKKIKKVRPDLTSQKDLKFVQAFNPQNLHTEAFRGDSVDPSILSGKKTAVWVSLNREEPNADEGNT